MFDTIAGLTSPTGMGHVYRLLVAIRCDTVYALASAAIHFVISGQAQ